MPPSKVPNIGITSGNCGNPRRPGAGRGGEGCSNGGAARFRGESLHPAPGWRPRHPLPLAETAETPAGQGQEGAGKAAQIAPLLDFAGRACAMPAAEGPNVPGTSGNCGNPRRQGADRGRLKRWMV